MNAPSVGRRALTILFATLLFLASGTLAWAAVSDYEEYDVTPSGTSVAGLDISGLTRDQARRAIETAIVAPVRRPVTIRHLGTSYTFPAGNYVSVNVDEMLDRAFAVREQSAIDQRVFSDYVAPLPPLEIKPVYSVDTAGVTKWVASFAARSIDRPYANASLTLVKNVPKLTKARVGYRAKQPEAARLLSAAILARNRTLTLPVTVLPPKIPDSKFSRVIVVDKSERRLYFYKDMVLNRKFRVAVGMPHYPTPLGNFKIVQKRYRPAWSNPGSAWAKSMPAYIPPGPSNPLGTRALNLNAPGIRIHGTNKISSIGTAASHGCIRMVRRDVEWLYDRVTVGTPVYVVK
jgi:lipoprotein-anchoring transpeptidase ErfK/SrfK